MPEYILAFLIAISILPISSAAKDNLENKITKRFKLAINENVKKDLQPKPEYDIAIKKSEEVFITAEKSFSVDLNSGLALSANQETQRTQIASLTKLMTAYIILKEENLDKVVTVPVLNNHAGDATMGVGEGETLTVKILLKGLLITSGSDAAQTLAITNSGSIDAFVVKMNKYAKDLQLRDTNFTNPVGWDDEQNFSTAKDIANLARILLRNDLFKEIVSTKSEIVTTTSGRAIALENTNKLLGTEGIYGTKTGFTPGAGECLVTYFKSGQREILTVILNSQDRFGITKTYLDWIFNHFSW